MLKLSIHTCLFLLVAMAVSADILFVSNRDGKGNIYVMNDDGSHVRRLTDTPLNVAGPRWSPDGRQIGFMMDLETDPKKWQQYDVFIMNADGTRQRNLTEHPSQDFMGSFSPDGKYIAFNSSRAADATLEIFVMEIVTRKVRKLTDVEFATSASWSPDGKEIAYEFIIPGAGRHIYIMGADGQRKRPLLRTPRRGDFGGTLLSFDPRWSPNGQRILYKESEFVPGKGRVANTILIVDKHTRHLKVLDTPQKWMIDTICWADDGDAVLFTAAPNGLANGSRTLNIYKYQLSNRRMAQLTDHPSKNWIMDWTPHNNLAVSTAAKLSTLWAEIKKTPE